MKKFVTLIIFTVFLTGCFVQKNYNLRKDFGLEIKEIIKEEITNEILEFKKT